MKKIKNILAGFVGVVLILSINFANAGVHDAGENEVWCDNECIVSTAFWGLLRICDAGTDSCIYKIGPIKIIENPEEHEK